MATQLVVFTRDHTIVRPATELTSSTDGGKTYTKVCDVAGFTTYYKNGQVVRFSNKKSALAFVKAIGGACVYTGPAFPDTGKVKLSAPDHTGKVTVI